MERRRLGKTNLKLSLLGLGGFHLVEVPFEEAVALINYYLDKGGNYLETAQLYGHGDSEKKVGEVMKTRRKECILATKSLNRTKGAILESINGSLKNLNTDWIDIFFLHELSQPEVLKEITAPGGALEGVEKAKKEGKIRFAAFSSHVTPSVSLKAIQTYPFDVVMVPLNYFDYFNFPQWEDKLLPEVEQRDVGVSAMKPFADGFLWRSWEKALRYTLTLPVGCVVVGANTRRYLEKDIKIADEFVPLSKNEREELLRTAPELGSYVCRQCGDCLPCPEGIDIPRIFLLEGQFDRQMKDGIVRDPPEYALRDRLRFWYGNQEYAQKAYQNLKIKATACTKCGICEPKCSYEISIINKLKIAHQKLVSSRPAGHIRID